MWGVKETGLLILKINAIDLLNSTKKFTFTKIITFSKNFEEFVCFISMCICTCAEPSSSEYDTLLLNNE